MNVSLNYIVIGLPQSKPCQIKATLSAFKGEIAKMARGAFAGDIRDALGLDVDPSKIRLWTPLNDLHQSELRSFVVTPADIKAKATLIPDGDTLWKHLVQAWKNKELVHILVTISEDYHECPTPPSRGLRQDAMDTLTKATAKLGLTKVPVLETGTWKVNEGRHWDLVKAGERYSEDVAAKKEAPAPAVVLGAALLDFGCAHDKRTAPYTALSYADNLSPTGMRLHLDGQGASRAYRIWVSWLRHTTADPLLQSGSIDASGGAAGDPADIARRVSFPRPYGAAPRVVVALSGLSVGGAASGGWWDVQAYATDVGGAGFTLNVERSRGGAEPLAGTQVHWFAYPAGGVPGLRIASGTFTSLGKLNTNQPAPGAVNGEASGSVQFEREFDEAPQVFVAITQFRAARAHNLRVRAKAQNVTARGMDWKLEKWDDTKLESATASWIAFSRD